MKTIAAALFLSASLAAPAHAADWWWVAGDSSDDAAVFVDGDSVRHAGMTASVSAVRIARDGTISTATWTGRCGARSPTEDIAAVAQFACGTEADHMQQAAMLPGLTPREAARAIFSVRAGRREAKPIQAG